MWVFHTVSGVAGTFGSKRLIGSRVSGLSRVLDTFLSKRLTGSRVTTVSRVSRVTGFADGVFSGGMG